MKYKNLQEHRDKTDIRDNDSGYYTQRCPFCGKAQMQINTDSERVPKSLQNMGRCHNVNCPEYHVWYSIREIDTATRREL